MRRQDVRLALKPACWCLSRHCSACSRNAAEAAASRRKGKADVLLPHSKLPPAPASMLRPPQAGKPGGRRVDPACLSGTASAAAARGRGSWRADWRDIKAKAAPAVAQAKAHMARAVAPSPVARMASVSDSGDGRLCKNPQFCHCGLDPQSPDLQFEILNQVQNDGFASFYTA